MTAKEKFPIGTIITVPSGPAETISATVDGYSPAGNALCLGEDGRRYRAVVRKFNVEFPESLPPHIQLLADQTVEGTFVYLDGGFEL